MFLHRMLRKVSAVTCTVIKVKAKLSHKALRNFADVASPPEAAEPSPKKRGRRRRFTTEQLVAAALKAAGKNNAEAAKILYATTEPTDQQRRNVSRILNYHAGEINKHPFSVVV
jgi:hypothetical protein